MYFQLIKRYLVISWLFLKNYRFIRFVLWTVLVPLLYGFNILFMKLDRLVFRSLENVEIKAPLFIIGHPRSGTSFLQKQLSNTEDLYSFSTWEILFPSLLQQKLFYPILVLMKKFNLTKIQSGQKGHQILIDETEEDEGLFLHHLDTEILTLFCPWLLIDDKYSQYGFRIGWNDYRNNEESIRFYREAAKRLLYKRQKTRLLAKCNPGLFRLQSIMKIFPDAKIMYLVREPEKSIKSFFSFHDKYVSKLLSGEEKDNYYAAKYRWSKQFYSYFEELKREFPENQLLIIPFQKLINNDEEILEKIEAFIGIKIQGLVEKTDASHQKKHTNSRLKAFDLSVKKIRRDLAYVHQNYLDN